MFVAVLFHVTGLTGILFINKTTFASLTPLNLLLTVALLFWTQQKQTFSFYLFFLLCFTIGFAVEILGIHTGMIFGEYKYGSALGLKVKEVPLLIGVNWFIVVYCCGVSMFMLQQKIKSRIQAEDRRSFAWWSKASVIIDGAVLAVFFDWVIEPVAIALNFWHWLGDGDIPQLNYISWFTVSMLLLLVFEALRFSKQNIFAVHLLLIQTMFFLILRTLLKT